MTTAQIAIPAVFLAFSALFVLARVVRRHNAARAHGRHENGHTVHHDGPPPTVRRLPSASDRAAAFSELATPCPDCGGGHIGGCGMRPGPASLPAHLRPGVVLPPTPKLALAPALEPLPPTRVSLGYDPLPELLPAELTGEEAAALRKRHAALPDWRGEDIPGPLPGREELTREEAADIESRVNAAVERQGPVYLLPGPGLIAGDPVVRTLDLPEPDLTITTTDAADEAYADVKARFGLDEAPPAGRPRPGGQTTGEIFEHLCEGLSCWCHSFRRLPAAVVRELKHETVDEAVASIVLHAKEAAEFRAELEARLAEDDAAHASGQVASDA